jgi:hypothetical protein
VSLGEVDDALTSSQGSVMKAVQMGDSSWVRVMRCPGPFGALIVEACTRGGVH